MTDQRSRQFSISSVLQPTEPTQAFCRPPNASPPSARTVTLWVEDPMYSQVIYCLNRVPAVFKTKPELARAEPSKTVLSGNRKAMAKLSLHDLEKMPRRLRTSGHA